jgi:hypothetical protein
MENRNHFQFSENFRQVNLPVYYRGKYQSLLFPFKNLLSWRHLCHLFPFMGTKIIIPYPIVVCNTVGRVDIGHHFESFTVATTIWLTAMEYLCNKWPRIYSTCRKHFPVLSSFMTYLSILIKKIRLFKYTKVRE